jgi:hypothetical protein
MKKSQGTFPGTDCGTDRCFPTGLCKMGEGNFYPGRGKMYGTGGFLWDDY